MFVAIVATLKITAIYGWPLRVPNISFQLITNDQGNPSQVELPSRFFPKSWPHHMRKEDSKKYHHSSSILGQLYDMAILDVDNLGSSWKGLVSSSSPSIAISIGVVFDEHFKFV